MRQQALCRTTVPTLAAIAQRRLPPCLEKRSLRTSRSNALLFGAERAIDDDGPIRGRSAHRQSTRELTAASDGTWPGLIVGVCTRKLTVGPVAACPSKFDGRVPGSATCSHTRPSAGIRDRQARGGLMGPRSLKQWTRPTTRDCLNSGSELRLMALVPGAPSIQRILGDLGLHAPAPPRSPARAPMPQAA